MKYRVLHRLILLFCISLSFAGLNAQQNNTLYFMHKIPQAGLLNPARQISCRAYIGIPALTGIHLNVGHTGFSYKQAIPNGVIDPDNIIKKMHKADLISTEFHFQILAFGYRKGNKYYSFNLTEKNELYFTYPRSLVELAWHGNQFFEGDVMDLKHLKVNMLHYREYAFGFSKKVDDYFSYGVRGKLLFGKANVNTKRMNAGFYTFDRTNEWQIYSKSQINVSAPINVYINNGMVTGVDYIETPITQLIINRKNPGLALDAGFIYNYDDYLSFSGSFNDLGLIRWRSFQTNLKQDGEFTFQGFNLNSIEDISFLGNLLDTIRQTFATNKTEKSYTTWLPLKVYLGSEYQLTPKISLGAMGRLMAYQYRLYPSLIVSANTNFAKFFTASLSYGLNNYAINNVGLGLGLQSKNFQFYLLADQILLHKYQSIRNVNLRFGFNLMFGCKKPNKGPSTGCGCHWLDVQTKKRERKNDFLKGK